MALLQCTVFFSNKLEKVNYFCQPVVEYFYLALVDFDCPKKYFQKKLVIFSQIIWQQVLQVLAGRGKETPAWLG